MSLRYALYFAPATTTPLWRVCSRLLGYDAAKGVDLEPDAIPADLQKAWEMASGGPARYGFHATLKPPMRLRQGCESQALLAAAERFCANERSFVLPELELANLGGFLALVPKKASPKLNSFAGRVVAYFEPFRAALNPAERARRNPDRLDAHQFKALETWGYPYVFETFAFHMTLTSRLEAQQAAILAPWYRARLSSALEQPLVCDRLSIFRQETPSARFQLWKQLPFTGH